MSPRRTASSFDFDVPDKAASPVLASHTSISATGTGVHFQVDDFLKPGTVIDGKYRIIKTIGQGGMGRVYLADHMIDHSLCAVKVLSGRGLTKVSWKRFMQEASALAQMDHPNLVKVLDSGVHQQNLPYFVMDYVDGVSLEAHLDEHGPMPEMTVLDIAHQVCQGLEFAKCHGIVHRDIKPGNIMLVSDKNNAGAFRVKILDFGLAKLTDRNGNSIRLTGTGEFFGSPLYMSPEQCLGDHVDTRSDIYSLGCTMFECLTGEAPFSSGSVFAVMSNKLRKSAPSINSVGCGRDVSPRIAAIVEQMLQRDPERRFQTVGTLKNALHYARLHKTQVLNRISVEEAVERYRALSADISDDTPEEKTKFKAGYRAEDKTLVYKFVGCLVLSSVVWFLCLIFFIVPSFRQNDRNVVSNTRATTFRARSYNASDVATERVMRQLKLRHSPSMQLPSRSNILSSMLINSTTVSQTSLPLLYECYSDQDPQVKDMALRLLCRAAITNPSCVPFIQIGIRDGEWGTQREALFWAGNMGPHMKSVLPDVLLLSNSNPCQEVYSAALLAAVKIDPKCGKCLMTRLLPNLQFEIDAHRYAEVRSLLEVLEVMNPDCARAAVPLLQRSLDANLNCRCNGERIKRLINKLGDSSD